MNDKLTDKVAIVTGGCSGIGLATTLALVQAGTKVVIADVQDGTSTLKRVHAIGGEASYIETDVTDAKAAHAMVRHTIKRYGRLDCAVNNAGVYKKIENLTHKCSEKTWDQVMGVNLKGVWLCMKYELPQMLKQGSGSIVNMSSIAGIVGLQDMAAYAASKHGVVGLTKSAALEYAQSGIRINAVCPGSLSRPTVRGDRIFSIIKPDNELHPMGRMCTVEDVTEAVLWLCTESSSFVTGHTLTVDGGRTAQ